MAKTRPRAIQEGKQNVGHPCTHDGPDLTERVDLVTQVAREHADDVDAAGRFPSEAVSALKQQRLLGVEPAPGKGLWTSRQIAAVARRLSQACASTGMIWGMHQGQIQGVARQRAPRPEVQRFLDESWERQPLVASLMSEVGAAGPRESRAFCEDHGDDVRVTKNLSVCSYLQDADAGLVVVRRSSQDPVTDPGLLLALRDEIVISRWKPWQALGMRGTGSGGGTATVTAPRGRLLGESFAELSARAITPITHIAWAGCWAGIADAGLGVARSYVRRDHGRLAADVAAARLARLGRACDRVDQITAEIQALSASYDEQWEADEISDSVTRRGNALRLSTAALAHDSVMDSFQVVGLDAYRDAASSRFSLGRQIRDVLSARVMISEDRIRLGSGAYAQLPRTAEPIPAEGARWGDR